MYHDVPFNSTSFIWGNHPIYCHLTSSNSTVGINRRISFGGFDTLKTIMSGNWECAHISVPWDDLEWKSQFPEMSELILLNDNLQFHRSLYGTDSQYIFSQHLGVHVYTVWDLWISFSFWFHVIMPKLTESIYFISRSKSQAVDRFNSSLLHLDYCSRYLIHHWLLLFQECVLDVRKNGGELVVYAEKVSVTCHQKIKYITKIL